MGIGLVREGIRHSRKMKEAYVGFVYVGVPSEAVTRLR